MAAPNSESTAILKRIQDKVAAKQNTPAGLAPELAEFDALLARFQGEKSEAAAEIAFATATGSWGTVTDWFIADNGTVGAGNILCYGTLTASKAIDSGDTAKAAANAITITLD